MDHNTLITLEWHARRLRAQHAGDVLARLVIAVDLHVRRLAHRLAGLVQSH